MKSRLPTVMLAAALATCAVGAAGCDPPKAPVAARPERADQWFKRAQAEFNTARVEDAHDAIVKALEYAPQDDEIRTLGSRIALARLEFDESLRLLTSIPGSEAHGLRGRAYWFRGDLTPAADELDALLDDPAIRDEWAKGVAGLARRGEGRSPFAVSGAPRAVVSLDHVSDVAPYFVVSVEIDGQAGLAVVSTGVAELMVDVSTLAQPSWVSVRFTGRPSSPTDEAPYIDVTDVPALTQDLSGLSKEMNAPIKALIGTNLLRRLNVTMDYAGRQFVVRQESASPPSNATRVNLYYERGGGMVIGSSLGQGDNSRATLFLDSRSRYPIALDDRGWVKAGVTPGDLKPVTGDTTQKMKEGVVPELRLGAFELKRVPGILDGPVKDIEESLRLDVDGVLGVPVLALYRITLGEGGRVMYLEDDSEVRAMADSLGEGPPIDTPTEGPINQSQPGPVAPGPQPDNSTPGD
ncbi:MAG: hypothetical protein U0271_27480 [Polyangiaceae bacterium]